jgi:hypothetical protein
MSAVLETIGFSPEMLPGMGRTSRPQHSQASVVSQGIKEDSAKISAQAKNRLDEEEQSKKAKDASSKADEKEKTSQKDESEDPQKQRAIELEISKLQTRDRTVRAHEAAHQAVGGQYAGAASYTYQNGPDGRRYAVGGEVPIDVSEEKTPQATIDKMGIVRRAALAPPDPSAADRAIAAAATQRESNAQRELLHLMQAQTAAKRAYAGTNQQAEGEQETPEE